jgi:hypothetical protein
VFGASLAHVIGDPRLERGRGPGLLLAVPAVLLLANAVAAIPARTAARTRPAVVLRTE